MSEDEEENGEEEKKEEYRSVTTREILGSKGSKIGLALLGIAVLCAFLSINQEIATSHDRGVLEGNEDGRELMKLEQKRSTINSTLELKFNSSNSPSESSIKIIISDFEGTYNRSIEVENGTKEEFDLEQDDYWLKYNLTDNQTLSYHQKLVYTHSPYRFLAIPAFILTIVGVVMFYQGKHSIKKEKELEREGRKEREKMKEKGGEEKVPGPSEEKKEEVKEPKQQFMGVDWGDIEEGEEIDRKDEEKR